MKKLIFGFVCLALFSFSGETQMAFPVIKNESFSKGEQLEYRVSFLGLNVGKAITKVDSKIYNINSRRCFKINAFG